MTARRILLLAVLALASCSRPRTAPTEPPRPKEDSTPFSSSSPLDSAGLFENLPPSRAVERIKTSGILSVGIDRRGPCRIDPATGRIEGFPADIAVKMARLLGLKPNFFPVEGRNSGQPAWDLYLPSVFEPTAAAGGTEPEKAPAPYLHAMKFKFKSRDAAERRLSPFGADGGPCRLPLIDGESALVFDFCAGPPFFGGLTEKEIESAEDVYLHPVSAEGDAALTELAGRAIERLYQTGAYQAAWRKWFSGRER